MFPSYSYTNSNISNVLWGNQTSGDGVYVVTVKQCLLISEEKLYPLKFLFAVTTTIREATL